MIECPRCGSGNATGRSRCRRCDAALSGAAKHADADDAVIDYSTSGRGGSTKILKVPSEPEPRLRSRPREVPFEVEPDVADVFTSVPMNERATPEPPAPVLRPGRRVRPESPTDRVSVDAARPSVRARKPPPPLPTEEVQTIVRKIGKTRPRNTPAPPPGEVAYVPGKGIVPRSKPEVPRAAVPPPVPAQALKPPAVPASPEPVPKPKVIPDEATLVTVQPVPPGQAAADMADVVRLGAMFAKSTPDEESAPVTADSPTRTQIDARTVTAVQLTQLGPKGEPESTRDLAPGRAIIGRLEGDVLLPNDPTVSPWHAQIFVRKNGVFIKDMGTTNGVHVQIQGEIVLTDGDSILMGGQRFVFRDCWDTPEGDPDTETLGAQGYDDPARLILKRSGGQIAGVYFVGESLSIGRERGALLFAGDDQMSPAHARIRRSNGDFVLQDESGKGGVFIAIRGEVELDDGHCFQVGRTRFRIAL